MSDETYRLCSLLLNASGLLLGGVLFVAVVGRDFFSKRIISPRLRLKPTDFPNGESTLLGNPPKIPARYFHVDVCNERPWIQADDVELLLLKFSIGENGKEVEQPMPGPLVIKSRRNHRAMPIGYKEVVYDLFKFVNNEGFDLMLVEGVPNNLQHALRSRGSFTATIQAKGHNGLSNKLIVSLDWSGEKDINRLDGSYCIDAKEVI